MSDHGHGHTHTPSQFNRAFGWGIAFNLGFVVIEAFYGWKVNSLSLLADAGHNLSDVAGLVLAWGGVLVGQFKPDARHTYGWKRGSILAAFINALVLLVAIGGLLWEALSRLGVSNHESVAQGETMMIVAGFGILVNAATAFLFMKGRNHDLNIRGAYLHMAADALVSAGVVAAGALSLWVSWSWLDPVVSLVIGAVIFVSTWGLFKGALHLLFDGVPDDIDPVEVKSFLEDLPGVDLISDLHIWAMGTSQVALTAHLVMPDGNPGDDFLKKASDMLHQKFEITHATLQITQKPSNLDCHQGKL